MADSTNTPVRQHSSTPPFLEFVSIAKHFGGVTALAGVSLAVARGECHALMGENGAGKSTLGRVLAGIHRPDAGEVRLAGESRQFHSPAEAVRAGIGMVHQELAFCPDLSVAENLCLGQYPRRWGMFTDRARMRQRARERLAEIGVTLEVTQPMRRLSTGQEQLVQIAAAVGMGARVLIFDEPTSSLSEPEAEQLFGLIARLRKRGVTMVYVSHRLPEVLRLCDRISVLRDGRLVGTLDRAEATEQRVVQLMIGRTLGEYFPRHLTAEPGAVQLKVTSLESPGRFAGVSFTVRMGEIVGLAGLVGSGRSEVARAIFGLDSAARGAVTVGGAPLRLGSTRSALRHGIGLVPEDRKRQGLIALLSGRANFSLVILERLRKHGLLNHRQERREAESAFARLRVRTPSVDTPVAALSGGNQQKVVLAKWLARPLQVLIVDEPTRGVDVGAKAAIHGLIDELAQQGVAVLLISSELPELLHLSTRILVMREGRLVGELARAAATQASVLRMMASTGGGRNA